MNLALIKSLARLHLITPHGLLTIVRCFLHEGITLMAALKFSSIFYPDNIAVVSDCDRVTYRQLYQRANRLAKWLYKEYQLRKGMRVALFCRNHCVTALLLPALSRLGVKIKLINTDICQSELQEMLTRSIFKLFIYDEEFRDRIQPHLLSTTSISSESLSDITTGQIHDVTLPRIRRGDSISIFTGGSSGRYHEASRRTGIVQFLPPFIALIQNIRIQNYNSVLVALPFYHGFGLATWIIAMVMGKKICLMRHFDALEALEVIHKEQIEVLPIVPAILARLWQQSRAQTMLHSVKCVISGGDKLDRQLVEQTHSVLGPVCFNLYGTTEAGFLMLATPSDLEENNYSTIGRPIKGVRCEMRNTNNEGIGTLWVKCSWAMLGRQQHWQSTGDLVFRNSAGYYFHRGRADRMVVCGGENVYPEHIESVLNTHPAIAQSMVYPAEHPDFGYVLHAQVELKTYMNVSEDELKCWLRPQLARAEMPHRIVFKPFTLLSTGKKQRLAATTTHL